MKTTGLICKIDDLGRITIPREVRRSLCIQEGDSMELYVGKKGVSFIKYDPTVSVQRALSVLYDVVQEEQGLSCSQELLKKINEMFALLMQ